ncbi:hypothetical protein Tco_1290883 [Tanacetum coccineum]
MFWHTARDDTMFTSMRCISRHEDTQVYGTILLTELTNQAMLESKAYQTYYAFASGEKATKPKYIQKKADSDTSPKKKPFQATKGTRLKSKAKVAKLDKKKKPVKKIKAKGLSVLFEVSLTEAEQLKLATNKSKKDFYISYESGLDSEDKDDNDDDGESDDHDYDSDDERTQSDKEEIPNPNLTNVDHTEHEEEYVDDIVHTPSDYELTNDEKLDDEETMYDEEDDEVIKELYNDVNVNLGNDDTEMTDAYQEALKQQNISQESGFKQVEEDTHVTLTPVLDTQKADEHVQSSSVSSDFTSKLLNLENPSPTDNEIASFMETSARHTIAIPKITPGFTTTTPPPPPVSALESKISEFRQTNQFAEAISSIPSIIPSKMKEAVDVAVQLQTNKLREEAQAENKEFLNQIEKYVTESLGVEVLVGSTNQPQTSYAVATTLSEFELKKILIEKIEANKSIDRSDIQKNLYNALVESYNNENDIMSSYGDVVILKRGQHDQDKDEHPSVRSDRGTKRRKSGKDAESFKDLRSKEKKSSSTSKDASQSQHKSSDKSAHAEEPSHTIEDSDMQHVTPHKF